MPYLIARGQKHDFSARVRLLLPKPGSAVRIGRADHVEVQLFDRSISKVHASLELTETGHYRVVDLGSKNGLRFEGRRCREFTVASGQEFVIGNLAVTIGGTGPETFRIPESVPRPEQGEQFDTVVSVEGSSRSRLVWLGVGSVFALLAVLGWALPAWLSRAGEDPSPRSSASTVETVSDQTSPTTSEDDPESLIVEPPKTVGTLQSAWDRERGDWVALGRELDSKCGSSGCHFRSNEVDFVGGTEAEYGRWARNLLRMKARGAAPTRSPRGFVVPAFDAGSPHDEEILLSLSNDAIDGVALVQDRTRLHGVDAGEFEFDVLLALESDQIARQRRVWRTIYGRDPSLRELAASHEQSLKAIVTQASQSPEFWRERARYSLRGCGEHDTSGGFSIPATLDPDRIPSDPKMWAELLEHEVVRSREVTPHGYGDPPPYPREDDSAYVSWVLGRVAAQPRPSAPDQYLRSVWTVLWGAPPTREEDRVLRQVVSEIHRDGRAWSRVVDALLYSPSMPFPSPPVGRERPWIASVTRWLLARDLPPESIEAIGDALAVGALDPRLVLRACLTSSEFVQLPVMEKIAVTRTGAPESIRVEAIVPFSVRELLAKPAENPRLRKWCEKSLVQIFPDDAVAISQLPNRALARRSLEDSVIVSHPTLCADADTRGVTVADGYLGVALRRLADRVGDGRVLASATPDREWLRTLLGVVPEIGSESSRVGRLAGFRFEASGWEASSHRPTTRALLVAGEPFGDSTSRIVWVNLDGSSGTADHASVWREFVDTLDILSGTHRSTSFDVWLWGRSEVGKVETVRLRWGGSIARGWVQRESQPARFTHPELQFEKLEGGRR